MSDKVTYSNSVLKITNEHGFAWGGSVTEETAREIVRVLGSLLTTACTLTWGIHPRSKHYSPPKRIPPKGSYLQPPPPLNQTVRVTNDKHPLP